MSSRFGSHDPRDVPAAIGGYTNAIEVAAGQRLLFISGQIPETQCRLIWLHIESCLESAEMTITDLVKVTTFLSSRELVDVNTKIRQEMLGDHRPALTVIVTELFDTEWKLEIEAIAAQAEEPA